MSLLKTAVELASETTAAATTKVAGGAVAARKLPSSSIPSRKLMGNRDVLGDLARNAGNGGRRNAPVKDPLGSFARDYQGSESYLPFRTGRVRSGSRIIPSSSSSDSAQPALVAPEGTTIPELLSSHTRAGNLNAADVETNARRAEKLRAREEYYSPTQSGPLPESPAERVFIGGESGVEGTGNVPSNLSHLIDVADDTGSVVGLLRRQNEILERRAGLMRETEIDSSRPTANMDMGRAFERGEEYRRLGAESDLINQNVQRIESRGLSNEGPLTRGNYMGGRMIGDDTLYGVDRYDEAAHTRANLTTTTENLAEGASSGGTGMLQPSSVQLSNSIMAALEGRGFAGMGASIGMGAVLGGTANYAMGGEFSEGAMMGGLAGGGIAIGARAVAANRESISGFLQRQVLGDAAEGKNLKENASAIVNMGKEEIGKLGLTQKAARAMLMQNPASPGLQSRHMVIGGSMLAGVAFTGRRNDRRRGFNAHRGNRI